MNDGRHETQHAAGALELHQRGPVGVETVEDLGVNRVGRPDALLVVGVAAVGRELLRVRPVEIREGPRKGLRVLGVEEDLARQLVRSLSDEQKKVAIYTNSAPREIITGNDRQAKALNPMGISSAKLNKAQTELLWRVIKEYVYRYRPELADQDLSRIEKGGAESLYFAWAGSVEPKEGHYYRVQGPNFLLEYDNTQNNANHVHAAWRDFEHDFGDDLLRQHYERVPHEK